jgi:hypothetical protein
MADMTKNVVSVIAVLLFVIGTGVTMVGVFRTTEMSEKHLEEGYIVPSQVLNGLTVMFLLYLTSTSSFSPSYKLLVILLLVGGMMIEIYLTSFSDRKPEAIAAYIFISLNFLIRTFFLVELIQGEWVKPFADTVRPVQNVMKEVVKEVSAAPAAIESIVEPKAEAPSSEPTASEKQLRSKWDKLKDMLQAKPEGLDRDSRADAWKNVIVPAERSGRTDIKEVLKEAVGKLKDKDGNPIPLNSVDLVGGRKKRS